MQLAVATLETDLERALGLAHAALALAEQGRAALLSASFESEALVLGALQREDTLRQRSPARFDGVVARRATTGTEARLSGAVLYHALALPSVSTLFADASARTLLNRNLRAVLRGYTAAGVPLRYFGTEVLALLGQPVALVGYDQAESGAILLEIWLGLEQPCVVRSALKREPPVALYRALHSEPPAHELLQRAVRGIVEKLGASTEQVSPVSVPVAAPSFEGVASAVSIPLGVVEATVAPRVRISGDLLVGTAALHRVERAAQLARDSGAPLSAEVLAPLQGAPLDGARPADVLQALELAASG
jgi:hypothetical protein